MDRPSGLYTESERAEWATLQAVPVYRRMIQNHIEIGSCQAVSQCPTALAGRADAGFNLGLLTQEVPGYSWIATLTDPTNWAIACSMMLAAGSVLLHLAQYCKQWRKGGTGAGTAVGVTINNTQEPVNGSRAVTVSQPIDAAPRFGVAEVCEAVEMTPVAPVKQRDQYGYLVPAIQQ